MLTSLLFFSLVALVGDPADSCRLWFCHLLWFFFFHVHFKGIFWKLLVYVYEEI